MKNKLTSELGLGIVLLILLFLLLNPFHWWMATSADMMILLGVIIAFGFFISFVWRERSRDEREEMQRRKAGRFAFLVGTLVLIIGIVLQAFAHEVDYWLVMALAAMVLAKTIGWMQND